MQRLFVRLPLVLLFFCVIFVSSKLTDVHRGFIKSINKVRQSKGLKPVCLSEKLNTAALKHSQWMGKHAKLIHGGDGDLKNRILKTHYAWNGAAAENIALNADWSAHNVVEQWVQSPRHYANIISGKYNQVGVGGFEAKKKIWWTMVLAQGNDKCALF